MRDEFDEPQPAHDRRRWRRPLQVARQVPAGIDLRNRDFLTDAANIPDGRST